MAEERTFLKSQDVTVTNARFMVAGQTFAMSNITSVKASKDEPARMGPIFFIVVGVVILMAAGKDGIAPALLFAGIGAVWALAQKTMYHVMLTTAGGETKALSSEQTDYIEKVVQALNDAIVARG